MCEKGVFAIKSKNVDMLTGPIGKGLLSLTIPIMIMNIMQNMFSIIDMTVLRNLVNDTAVGAVGACSTLITLCTGLLIGIATGANVIVARFIGTGDRQRTEESIGTRLAFSILGGFVLLMIGVSCAEISVLENMRQPEFLLQTNLTEFFIMWRLHRLLLQPRIFRKIWGQGT